MSEHLRPAPTPGQITLRALSTRRRQLIEQIAVERTRLGHAPDPAIAVSHRQVIKALAAACAEIEGVLDLRIAAEPDLARKRTILTSIPGIGPRIASVLITDMPELGQVDRKAAASLAGMAPHSVPSGAHAGRHAIAGGRPCLRTAFYMAGMLATRSCPASREAYAALRAAGKPAKVAIVASGRRLVVLANALIRDDTTFEASKRQKREAGPAEASDARPGSGT